MTTVRLEGARGVVADARPVLEALLGWGPSLAWCEPVPGRVRRPGFRPLWAAPAPGADLGAGGPVEEARLFWRGSSFHLHVNGGRARWAAVWEGEAPGWLGALAPVGSEPLGEFERVERRVLTQRDLSRYGLAPSAECPEVVRLIEYRDGTRLAFWRLEEGQ